MATPVIDCVPWPEDSEALATLWAPHLGGVEPARRKLTHAYLNNPAGAGLCLTATAHGQPGLLGALGLHQRRFWRGTQAHRVHILADFVVAPGQRTLGPALGLMRGALAHAQPHGETVMGWPNARSQAVVKRVGLTRLLGVQRYAKPLRSRLVLQRWLSRPGYPWLSGGQGAGRESLWQRPIALPRWLSGALIGAAAPWLDGVLRLVDHRRPGRPDSPAALTDLSALSWQHPPALADTLMSPEGQAALDTLWAHRPARLWLSERSPEVLAWRFLHGDWRISLCHASSSRPVAALGYVIWRTPPPIDGQQGPGLIEIGDFWAQGSAPRSAALLHSFGQSVRDAEGAQLLSLEFGGSPAVHQALLDAGFWARGTAAPVYGHLPETLGWDADQAYLTSLDRDPDL